MVIKSKPLTISVIIVNYNSSPFIKDCIESLLRYTDQNRDEIIVVDNNSTDNSRDIIEKYKKVQLIRLNKNIGYGAGCNTGAKKAKCDILLCMNPDVQLRSPLNSVREIFMSNNDCAVIAPVIVSKNKIYSPLWSLPTVFGEFLGEFKIFSRKYHPLDRREINTSIQINKTQFASGAALFIRKLYFNKIDGFDENFFMYFEDIDLFVKVHRINKKCYFDIKTEISHLVGGSTRNDQCCNKILSHYVSKKYYFIKYNSKLTVIFHIILTIMSLFTKLIIRLFQCVYDNNHNKRVCAYFSCIKLYFSF